MGHNPWELTLPMPRSRMGEWTLDGLCGQLVQAGEADPDWWFPERGQTTRRAKAICARCPVTEPCLAWALENGEPGVWGGTSEGEREGMPRLIPCTMCNTPTAWYRGANRTLLCSDECRRRRDNERQRNYKVGTQAQYMADYRARQRESA